MDKKQEKEIPIQPSSSRTCNQIEALREELENESKNRYNIRFKLFFFCKLFKINQWENISRNNTLTKYTELKRKIDEFQQNCEGNTTNPKSKYDTFLIKQNCINENLQSQIHDAKKKLKSLKHSVKDSEGCCCPIRDTCKDCSCNTKVKIIYYFFIIKFIDFFFF